MKTFTITAALLRQHKACPEQVKLFHEEWPKGCEVTATNLKRAQEIGLDLAWGVCLLPPTVQDDYLAKLAPIQDDYRAKRAPIDSDYLDKRAPIQDDYRAKRDTIYADYLDKLAPIDSDYLDKLAPIQDDYWAKLDTIVLEAWLSVAEDGAV
jgi:hypothetical protein